MVDKAHTVMYNTDLHEQNLQKGARYCEKESVYQCYQSKIAPVLLIFSFYAEDQHSVGAVTRANGFLLKKGE